MHIILEMIKYILGFIRNLFNPAVSLFCLIDHRSHVSRKAKVYRGKKVYHSSLGDYSYLGGGSSLVYARVGKFCSIAGDVKIGMGTHTLHYLSTSPIFTEKHNGTGASWVDSVVDNPFLPVVVGNDVWIGERAMVLGGVTVGDGAIIGAGAIVTKDVPPFSIVAGVPARVIRDRFPESVKEAVLETGWWDLPEEELKENIGLFQEPVGDDFLDRFHRSSWVRHDPE